MSPAGTSFTSLKRRGSEKHKHYELLRVHPVAGVEQKFVVTCDGDFKKINSHKQTSRVPLIPWSFIRLNNSQTSQVSP